MTSHPGQPSHVYGDARLKYATGSNVPNAESPPWKSRYATD
jgi:hypothetical protein